MLNQRGSLIRGSIVEGDINCDFYCLDHPASIASNTADSRSRWTTPSTRTRPADPGTCARSAQDLEDLWHDAKSRIPQRVYVASLSWEPPCPSCQIHPTQDPSSPRIGLDQPTPTG